LAKNSASDKIVFQ